jgi:YidC/Oxa1 family membrane protein insertase
MDDRRSLITMMVVSLVFGGAYLAYSMYLAPSEEEGERLAAEEAGEESAADGEPRGETETDAAHGDGPAQHVDPEQRLAQEQRYTLESREARAEVSNLNGGLTSVRLLLDRYLDDSRAPQEVITTDKEEYYPFRAELLGVPMPADAVYDVQQVSPSKIVLSWEGSGFAVTRTLETGGPYEIWSTIEIENQTGAARNVRVRLGAYHYVTREEEGAGILSFATRSPKISQGVCAWGDGEITRLDREGGLAPRGQPSGHGFGENVLFAGTENTYFASVLAADGEMAERCRIEASDRGGTLEDPHGSLFETELIYPRVAVAPGEIYSVRTLAYVGPKDNDALVAAGHGLTQVVDLGWFSVVAQYFIALLRLIYGFAGNWGLAIILMTFLVRLLMLPLTWKSFQSMGQMRMLKPEIDKLNEMYKEDPQQKGAAMMELYRKRGVSPFGGCLPSLLQMPVWFAFYASLSTNVELYHASFAGWYTDLSAPDPFFVLPLLVGVLMHFQQRLTPVGTDATQAKIMMWLMPIMITSFLLFLPSGLCLYMVTNSVLGMGQQVYIQRNLEKKEAEAKAKAAAEEAAAEEAMKAAEDESADADKGSSVLSRTRLDRKKKKKRKKSA